MSRVECELGFEGEKGDSFSEMGKINKWTKCTKKNPEHMHKEKSRTESWRKSR